MAREVLGAPLVYCDVLPIFVRGFNLFGNFFSSFALNIYIQIQIKLTANETTHIGIADEFLAT